MKNIIIYILLIVSFLGCNKTNTEPTLTSAGDWILIDAKVYIKRWGAYPLDRYDLLNDTIKYNCVDLNGNEILLDQLYKDSTRWTLPADRYQFILNNTKTYETQSGSYFIRVFPTEDGSARVFLLDEISPNYLRWRTSEREQALYFNGVYDNYTYYTKLVFKRIGTNDPINLKQDQESSTYKGVIPRGIIKANVMSGHTWVIYKYKQEGFNSYQNISDTLYFVNNHFYHLNTTPGNQDLGYSIYDMGSYYSMDIDHTRFGANISCANIPKTALDMGDIQNAKFLDNTIGQNGTYYYLFMKRIK